MKKVLVFGSFDILHPGHLHFFQQAKQHGNLLYVIIARDRTIKKIKGKKPHYHESERKTAVEKLEIVDKAFFGDLKDPYKIIEEIKPDVICLGYDQTAFIDNLQQELKKRNLNPKIIRLKAHKPEQYKSSRFRTSAL